MEYLILGDCFLLINNKVLTDDRVTSFFDNAVQQIEQKMIEGKKINRKEIFREIRKLSNQKNGYWIGSIDGIGIENAIIDMIPLSKNTVIKLMSDGFYEDYCRYSQLSIEEIVSQRPSQASNTIFGKRDDASVIVITF